MLTVLLVFAVALWPMRLWRWQLAWFPALFLFSLLSRLPAMTLVRRAALLSLFAGVMTLGSLGKPDWVLRSINLVLKSWLCLWMTSLLVHKTPVPSLVEGLRYLRLPAVWTEAFAFWGRYYSVLTQEWQRLQLARRARTFDRSRSREFRALTNALGLLFIRAYERAEQVHKAMLARGYRETR